MADFVDIKDLDSDPDIATALGNMVVAWASAESAILYVMCAICNMHANQAHHGYYRIPTFEARVKFLQGMIPVWTTPKYDKVAISEAIEAIRRLSDTRNSWIHGIWSKKTTGQVVVFNFRAPEDKGRNKPVKAHDINLHVSTLKERTKALRALLPDQP